MTRRMIAPLLFGLVGIAILFNLGSWQLRRLDWKEGIIAQIEERLSAAPAAIPLEPSEPTDEYRHIRVKGMIGPGEIHVYTSIPSRGVGYRVIVPFALADGRTILLDRGFIPIAEKDAARLLGEIDVDGALLWPDEVDGYTSDPDLEKNIWFARDLPRMAAELGTLPILLVTSVSNDPDGPLPQPVSVNIKNDHLEYAITWFLLAFVWVMMTGFLLWRIKHRMD